VSFAYRTERLLLRSWRNGDLDLWDKWLNVPEVARTVGGLQSREEIGAGIDRLRACETQHGHSFWALERLDDGAFLGFCGLKRLTAPGVPTSVVGAPEIGWRLRTDAWGQGYAREAALAALQLGFGRFGFDAVYAITLPHNDRSWGLMRRLGMTPRPELDFDMPVHGRHVTYSIGRDAWMG
jgi:RimJ/RimL family protein N-acetyltransferase